MNKRILFFAAASLLAGTSQAQTVYTWSGTDGLMNTAANWSPAAVPLGTAQDRMLFNGTSAVNAISFPGGTFGGNPGLGGVTVAAAQTNALTITNTGASGSVFRLNSNAGVTVESGAGALTFGGSGVAYIINLGSTTGTVNTFTNDSANTATVASNVNINTSGGTNGQAAFTGTGDWVIAGNITGAVSRGVIKNGTGNLTLSGTGNNFAGLTINGGIVHLGNNEVINNNQTVTVNAAGILNLNAFSETVNGITGNGMIQNEGSGTSTLTVGANNGTTTFSGTIRNNSGAVTSEVALTKTGTGTLTLAGTNTYTGLTTVSGGTLALTSSIPGNAFALTGGSLGGEATIGGNVFLEDGSGLSVDPTTAGAMHVAGNLSLNGTVNLTLAKSPISTAPFTLLTYAGSLTGSAVSFSVVGGSTNYRTPTIDDSVPNIITASVGTAARTWKGGAAWDVNTSLNWVEGDEKFLQVDSVTFGDTGAGTVAITGVLAPSSITVNSALDYTFTAAANNLITGAAELTKSGVGTLNLGGVNTFTGNITINGGLLKPTTTQALGANPKTITIASGAALDTSGMLTVARDFAAVISGDGIGGTGAIVNTGAAHNNGFTAITLAGNATIGGTNRWDIRPITVGAGVLNLAGFTLTKTGTNTIAIVDSVISADGQIDINQGALALSRNTVSGAGSINVNNTGILRFENNNTGTTITKPMIVNNGTINVIGTTPYTVDSPVTITTVGSFDAAVNLTLTNSVTGNGMFTKLGAGAVILTGNATHSGGTTVTAGTLQIGNGGTTGSLAGDIANAGNVTFNRLDDTTISNVISGIGSVTKLGAGNLSFSNPQTYTGATSISAGNIVLTGANRLPIVTPVTLTNTVATNLNLNGFSQEIRSLAGGGPLGGNVINSGAAATLTIRPTTTDGATFAGLLDGNIRLHVMGDKIAPSFVAPRQRLANLANTFNGGLLVDGATLMARQDGSLGAIPATFDPDYITLQNNGTLLNEADLNALSIHENRGITLGTGGGAFVAGFNQNVTVNSVITGAVGNNLTILGNNGTVIFTADNTYLGDTILGPVTANGTSRLRVGNGGLTGTLGGGNVSNEGQLTFNRDGNYAFAGTISGTGTVTSQGPGTVSLNGACSYTGATTISAGTLAINNTHGVSPITVAAAGTLAGTGTISGTVAVDGTLSPGNSVGKLTTTSLTDFRGGSKYVWEIGNWIGSTPGVDWDHFATQEFTTTATTGSKMVIAITGTPTGFSEATKSFEIARSDTPFQPAQLDVISIDASAFTGTGTWSLSLANANAALVLTYTSGAPNLYQTWIDSFTSITDPLKKTPTADADADGLANMVEYVLNADPSSGASSNRPTAQLSPNGENLVFVFTRLKEAATAGFTSSVEYSETLLAGSWTTATGPMTAIQDNGATETLTVTIPIPSEADSIFARLVVTAP